MNETLTTGHEYEPRLQHTHDQLHSDNTPSNSLTNTRSLTRNNLQSLYQPWLSNSETEMFSIILSLQLSVANVLSQRRWHSVPHTWFSDAETSVTEPGVRPTLADPQNMGTVGVSKGVGLLGTPPPVTTSGEHSRPTLSRQPHGLMTVATYKQRFQAFEIRVFWKS